MAWQTRGEVTMAAIDAECARRLLQAQFPQWAHLPMSDVPEHGWDNRTFRLGDAMKVRLPSAGGYAAQVEKEARWLPVLAPRLPVKIPEVVGVGVPGEGYPWAWSVQSWMEGTRANIAEMGDGVALARDVATFLLALRAADATGGPAAGAHSFHRGGELEHYDVDARRTIRALADAIDQQRALAAWNSALASRWINPPAWVHGDVEAGNLLVRDGRLCGVIDFGCMAVGDPACDLAVAWTLFGADARAEFHTAMRPDGQTWRRARGWALWKALITLAANRTHAQARQVIAATLADVD
jgi:aminoglycoside phosphotransferase (APT) family kinase protein